MISGKALTVPCFYIFSRVHHIIADPVATFSGFCCQVQGSILHRKERYMDV